MKRSKKKIKLLKALAFPVSAWFMFNVGSMVVQAEEVNPVSSDSSLQTVETTRVSDSNDQTTVDESSNTTEETDSSISLASTATESVSYQTHVQDIGWQSEKEDGQTAGTTNQSKRLEAIDIKLDSQYEGNIVYQTHIQDIGWQDQVINGEQSGTTGQSKRLEAIRIWLTGDIANHYSIMYRTHIQNIGWQDWVSDGLLSGTTNRSLRLEAIEIKLVDLSQSNYDLLQYTTHVQDVGWQGQVTSGNTAGTTGQSKRVEGIIVYLNDSKYSGNISYQAHVQDIGWQSAVSNRSLAGTTGQSKRIEAVRFTLEGEIAQYYDIYYRVHSSDYGWFDWACNGTIAGITGLSKKLEAIEIKLVEKGSSILSSGYTSIQGGVAYYADGTYYNGTLSFDGVEYTSADGVCYKTYIPVTYYSQRDGRWAGTVIGSYTFDGSGCCISVLTSIVNKLLNTNYIPTQIGQIVHNAGYFNTGYLAGTNADGIVYLCNYFGLCYKNCLNYESMQSELLSGHLVMAALGYNVPLCPWYGVTHEVLLYGYNSVSGLANVNDPYNSANNGEYSLSFIYNHPSNDSGDLLQGGPFFSIYKA